LALAATGCDVATNQTGGGWLSSQQGIAPPNAVVIDVDVPWSRFLQEYSASPAFQVGQWQGSTAASILWIPVDSSLSTPANDTGAWSGLDLRLGLLDSLLSRTDTVQVVREVRFRVDSTKAANWFVGVNPSFADSAAFRDTVSIARGARLHSGSLPEAVRDSIAKLRTSSAGKAGVLVRLLPLATSKSGIVQLTGAWLHVTRQAPGDTANYFRGNGPWGKATRGFVSAAGANPEVPMVQGGPVDWVLRLFPDTAAIHKSVGDALEARGYARNLRAVSVLDARLSFNADTSRSDSAGHRLRLLSAVGNSPDVSVWIPKDSVQNFDSVHVGVARGAVGDSLKLSLASHGGLKDSLWLMARDTLPVAHAFGGIRWVFKRTGDSVLVVATGVAAGLVEESQKNRDNLYNSGAWLGTTQTLSARRAFAALLNWSDRQPEIQLRSISSDNRIWWQMRIQRNTAKVRLTLLPLGGAK
jgi:hypothetical protein